MKKLIRYILFLVLLNFTQIVCGEHALTASQIREFADMISQEYEIEPSYTYAALAQAKYLPEIIQKITKPAEKMQWYTYRQLVITPTRIQKGINFMDKNKKLLDWASREYGVPPNIVVALLSIETNVGENMGNYRVLDTLSTLAYHHPPRAKFFKKELASFLLLSYTQEKNPTEFYGSYAGAMGMCQFMPSTYLYYAVSFQGQQQPDLYNNKADIIFSVGNFFRQHGWDIEKPIAVKAIVKGQRYRTVLQPNRSFKTKYTLAQLEEYGITPAQPIKPYSLKANLISLNNNSEPEFWLGFHNYYVIKHYNNSHLYAMSVYQLSLAIQKGYEQLLHQRQSEKLRIEQEKLQKQTARNTIEESKGTGSKKYKKQNLKPKREPK